MTWKGDSRSSKSVSIKILPTPPPPLLLLSSNSSAPQGWTARKTGGKRCLHSTGCASSEEGFVGLDSSVCKDAGLSYYSFVYILLDDPSQDSTGIFWIFPHHFTFPISRAHQETCSASGIPCSLLLITRDKDLLYHEVRFYATQFNFCRTCFSSQGTLRRSQKAGPAACWIFVCFFSFLFSFSSLTFTLLFFSFLSLRVGMAAVAQALNSSGTCLRAAQQ